MKRYYSGRILLDAVDIVCLSFSAGATIAYSVRKYKERRNRIEDPLVTELRTKSSLIVPISATNKPIKLPLTRKSPLARLRGGNQLQIWSLVIKSKRLSKLLRAIVEAKKGQKIFRLLQINFAILNALLATRVGISVGVAGSLDWTQILLIAVPGTAGGFFAGLVMANPVAAIILPLVILRGRGIEDVPDAYERCRFLCKAAEQYHNKELLIQMQELGSIVDDTSSALGLPLDKVPLVCVEEKLSLLERFKLRQVIKSAKAKGRVQEFSTFIKQFPECNPEPETVYNEIIRKVTE